MKKQCSITKISKYLFYVILVVVFYGCEHPERMAWNWNDNPKSICDTTISEGIITATHHPSKEELIITINNNGKITKWFKDGSLSKIYLVNDTIKHCH